MLRTHGAYHRDPLYNNLQLRKVNVSCDVELLASLEGFTNLHPLQADEDSQGALELMYYLQEKLKSLQI